MFESTKTYLIDAGNTHVKMGVVNQGLIEKVERFSWEEFKALVSNENLEKNTNFCISSVLNEAKNTLIEQKIPLAKWISVKANDLMGITYATPNTLGKDRWCNAMGAKFLFPTKNDFLTVDIGTCIKFDLVTNNVYQGGAISPGLQMRFKALHTLTDNLPLLTFEENNPLVGTSTQSAIQSGVYFGMLEEIKGVISRYLQENQNLTIIITGGDAKYFDFELKNNIFANENLTLYGIYQKYVLD
jgi:type III pantothenate kinase